MTTPTDPGRDGPTDDLPYLPPPSIGSAGAPSPVGTTIAPDADGSDPESTPPLDARELVDAQRQHNASPAYGELPASTEAGREAAQRLRADARLKRRRDTRLGWTLATVMFGVAAVAGWLVYRPFGNESPDRTDDRVVASDDVAGAATEEPAGAGRLAGAVVEAREVLAGSSVPAAPTTQPDPGTTPAESADAITEFDTVPPDQTGPPPRIANRPEFRTMLYDLRVYAGIEIGAPFRHSGVTYDTLTDDYYGFVDDSATGAAELVSFNGDWRYSVGPDGIVQRVRRSKFSLNSEPDTPLARMLVETDVLPLAARPYASLVQERPDVLVDGTDATVLGYLVDMDAFRASDPEAFLTWRRLWSTSLHHNVDLIVPGTEQVRSSDVEPFEQLRDREQVDLSVLEEMPTDGRAAITFTVTERGVVAAASVLSPKDDLRVVYHAVGFSDDPGRVDFPEDGWVDAP